MNEFPLAGLFLALIGLLILSGFFSGSETALMTLNRYRMRHQAQQGHRGAELAARLLDRPDRLIGLILLGNNFVNILASSLATVIALRLGGEGAIAVAAGLLTLVLLVFSEVSPKTLAALHPERLAYPAAFVYVPLLRLLYPIVWFVNLIANGLLRLFGVRPNEHSGQTLSQEELRTVVTEAGAMIPERSRDMLLAILNLEQATVEDIMVPRHEVEGIDLRDDAEDIINTIKRSNYARLPLFDGSIDNVVGIFHARSALAGLPERDGLKDALRALAREPYFVLEGTRLYQQLISFQRKRERIALIVDEYGDFQGMVTLADLVEEIVGEITTDPSDSFSDIHSNEDGSLLLDGGISLRELNRALQWELPTDGPKTLNGLILDYMETIPEPGTSLKLHGYPLEILQADDRVVKTVKTILPKQLEADVATPWNLVEP